MRYKAIGIWITGCILCLAGMLGSVGLVAADEPKPSPNGPRVVFVIYEDEYKADETLPAFARLLTERRGCRCCVLLGGEKGIEGLEALKTADVMVLFARRKALPKEQLEAIRAYLDAGKPLVALRTSCHAFALRSTAKMPAKAPEGSSQWPTFDVDVLGCHYANHLGNKEGTTVANAPAAAGDPILAGVEPAKWHSSGSLYKVLPLEPGAKVLMTGSLGETTEPVTWTRTYRGGRVFSTTLGHPDDFALPQFQTLLMNGICWAAGK